FDDNSSLIEAEANHIQSARHSALPVPFRLTARPRPAIAAHATDNHIWHSNNRSWQKRHYAVPATHRPWFLSLPDIGLWTLVRQFPKSPSRLYVHSVWPDRFLPA